MRRTLRPTAALAMVATVAVISAGCGGTGSTGGTNTASPHAKAVKFAECMRANGVSTFPDPDASGELTVDAVANRSSVDTNTATWKQALGACKTLQPPGFTGSRATPAQQSVRLQFAQCIRDNGVKDFPDPTPDSPMIDTNRIPSAATSNGMSILHAAMRNCAGHAEKLGVRAP